MGNGQFLKPSHHIATASLVCCSTQTFMTPALFSHAVTKIPALQAVWQSRLIVELMGQQDGSAGKDFAKAQQPEFHPKGRREPRSTSSLTPIRALWHTYAIHIHTHSCVTFLSMSLVLPLSSGQFPGADTTGKPK